MLVVNMKKLLIKGSYKLIFILGIVLFINGCGDSGNSAEEHLNKARTSIDSNDFNGGIIELKNALQKDPDLAEARWLLGKSYLAMGNGPAAVKEIERAAALGYSTADSQIALYRALLMKGDFQEVLDLTDAMASSRPSADLLAIRAEAHLGLKHADEARESFAQALESDSESVESHLGIARMSLAYGEVDVARKHIEKGLEVAPEDLRAWILKGLLETANGNNAEAELAFAKALEFRSTEFNAMLGIARAQLTQGKIDESLESLAKLDAAHPNNPMSKYLRGYIALQRGEQQAAKDLLRDVLKDVPKHPQTLLLLGDIYYKEGELQQAEEYIQRFRGDYPNHLPTIKLLAAIQISKQDVEEAIKTLSPSVKNNPNDAQLLALLGSAHMKAGNSAKGTEFLDKAAKLDPNAASIRTQLALSHLVSGATEQAVAELESAVALNPDMVQADVLLVLSQLRNKNYDAALEAARNLSAKQPKSPLPFNLIGAAYIGKGDLAGAREYFELALKTHPDFTPAMVNLIHLEIQEGHRDKAKERIEQVLALDPANTQALITKARFAAEDGKDAESLEILENARSGNASAFQPRLLLGRFYAARNDAGKSLEIAEEMLQIAPEHPDTLLLLGQAQRLNRDYNEALKTFQRLANSNPDVPEVLYQLALSTAQVGDFAESRKLFEKTLKSQPKHLRAEQAITRLDIREEKYEDAMKHALDIQKHYPERSEGKILEAEVFIAQKKNAQALAALQEAYTIKPSTGLAIKIAQVQKEAGKQEDALESLRTRVTEYPDDLGAQLALATMYQESGDKEQAITDYNNVLKQDSNNTIALNNLAWLYQEAGRPEAIDLAQKAHQSAPDSPEVADTLGWILVLNNKFEQGLNLLKKANRDAPESPDIRYHLAAALAKSGDTKTAISELETALESNRPFIERAQAEELLKSLR